MTLNQLLDMVSNARPAGNGNFTCRCPAHDDRQNSFSITESEGKLLVKCFAGCSVDNIVSALGITKADLFTNGREEYHSDQIAGLRSAIPRNGAKAVSDQPVQRPITIAALADDKQLPVNYLVETFGLTYNGGVIIPYQLPDGAVFRNRKRTALRAKDGSHWLPGAGQCVYGLHLLEIVKQSGYAIFVEGESDTWTGHYHCFPVLGVPGADAVKAIMPEYLEGLAHVYFVREPDKGGATFAEKLPCHLRSIGYTGDVFEIVLPDGAKDLNALYKLNPDTFKETLTGCMEQARRIDADSGAAKRGAESPSVKAAFDISPATLDFVELLRAELPERKAYLTWLYEGSLCMVYAARGLGKTWFGLSLAVCLAAGESFMKWRVAEAVGVLYIDGEMPLGMYRERLTGFVRKAPVKPIVTLSHETFYERFGHDLSITDARTQDSMLGFIDANPDIRVVIIDNLSALAHIREDKSDDWRSEILPFLIACRRRGVAVVLVHHAGKNGDQRGTGAREDHLDSIVKLSKAGDEKHEGAHFKVEFTKARGVYGADVEPFIAKLETVNGFFEWGISGVEQNTEKRLLGLIDDMDGITVSDAAKEMSLSMGMISRLKKKLLGEKTIKMSGKLMVKEWQQ